MSALQQGDWGEQYLPPLSEVREQDSATLHNESGDIGSLWVYMEHSLRWIRRQDFQGRWLDPEAITLWHQLAERLGWELLLPGIQAESLYQEGQGRHGEAQHWKGHWASAWESRTVEPRKHQKAYGNCSVIVCDQMLRYLWWMMASSSCNDYCLRSLGRRLPCEGCLFSNLLKSSTSCISGIYSPPWTRQLCTPRGKNVGIGAGQPVPAGWTPCSRSDKSPIWCSECDPTCLSVRESTLSRPCRFSRPAR